ncbi:MAG: hypothetical protein L6Q77_13055 [Bacteroidetes bacterium]|nr:hypothetical protein [Bacteroidota bacterium]
MRQKQVVSEKNEINARQNTLQRRLTQQLLDEGLTRDIAIKHASITIQIALDGYDKHGKPLPQILKNSLLSAIEDFLNSDFGKDLDIYNQKNPRSEPVNPVVTQN